MALNENLPEELKSLLLKWNEESEDFNRINRKFVLSVDNLKDLNIRIYEICQKHSIDINKLNLK